MLRLRMLVPAAALLVTTAACGGGGGDGGGGLSLDANLDEVFCQVSLEPAPGPCTAVWIVQVTNETDAETPAPDFTILFGEGGVEKNDCEDPLGPDESCTAVIGVSGEPGDSAQVLATSGFLFGTIELDIPPN